MPMSEKIRIVLVKRGNMSESELARRLSISPQNLYNKMKRDNFSEKELSEIAQVLDCTLKTEFIFNDTGEIV